MSSNQQNDTKLQKLTPTEMLRVHGGGRRSDGDVHCYESPNKVINDDSVWYEVDCESANS